MRDNKFVAEHRGGPLTIDRHRQLINWACACAEHIVPLSCESLDVRLKKALLVARDWEMGKATTGDAMKASRSSHAVARELSDPIAVALARAVGHAVATAHMADHSLGAALYALKVVKYAGKSIEEEKKWQNERLPAEISELVLTAISVKEKYFIK